MEGGNIDRRKLLKLAGITSGLSFLPELSKSEPAVSNKEPFTYCLNLATIRGHKLGMVKELKTAADAGFYSVEIWTDTLETYLSGGGKLKDLRRQLDDSGMKVENAIGFAQWIVDDQATRRKAIEQLKREMDQLAELGCARTAAPPAGATEKKGLDLRIAGDRYREILMLGEKTGVMPQLELWGFSANLNKLSDLLFVAAEAGHPGTRLLLDVYHIYKGGTSIGSLHLMNSNAIEVFHMNDYPAALSPEKITDSDRIYTGDGVAPIREILELIKHREQPLIISFEVFNKNYYQQDPVLVARTALKKMKKITAGL